MTNLQSTAQVRAIQFGESLMPNDCFDILIDVYGEKRCENMLPKTLADKLCTMMCVIADGEDYREYIEEIVESWMNNF